MSTASFLYRSSTISSRRVRYCFSPSWSPLYVSVTSASAGFFSTTAIQSWRSALSRLPHGPFLGSDPRSGFPLRFHE